MWLLVGLGNPGPDYARTRHNIGFMAADVMAARYGFSAPGRKFQGELAEGRIGDERVFLLKPMTFMNLSGQSVGALAQFYKIGPENVLVIYDDVDLEPGKVRVKQGGGSGGHNGIKSIDAAIGVNYHRLRIGVGKAEHATTSDHVLGRFSRSEEEGWVRDVLDKAAEHLPVLLCGDGPLFMTRMAMAVVNGKKQPKEKEKEKG